MFYINILIVNIIVLLLLSNFWSKWTYKLFKPFVWQDERKRKHILPSIEKIEAKMKDRTRFYSFWFLLRQIDDNDVVGDMACAGLDGIDLAKLMHNSCPQRNIYLLDSFDKKPVHGVREDCDGIVREQVVEVKSVDVYTVLSKIAGNSNVIPCKGDFPEVFSMVDDRKFAFVAVDIIFYEQLSASLKFFYDRLSDGGIMIVHDYNHNWDDVRRAVNDFARIVPENFISLPDMYGSVVMVKNGEN